MNAGLKASSSAGMNALLLTVLLACGSDPAEGLDAGPDCSARGCVSSLELRFAHSLDLAAGPYRLEVTLPGGPTPRCTIGPDAEGDTSCFGFRFANLRWDAAGIVVRLAQPFSVTPENPTGAPQNSGSYVLRRGSEMLSEGTVAIDAGPELRPNGPLCPPTCWAASGSTTL